MLTCLSYFFFFSRYLESCNIPITVKRKYQVSSNTTSSNSDDDKKGSDDGMQVADTGKILSRMNLDQFREKKKLHLQ